MSYDLNIFTTQKQNYEDLRKKFNVAINDSGFELQLNKSYSICVLNEVSAEEDDMPPEVFERLPGLQYLIECYLQPYTESKKDIKKFLKLAKLIAKNGHGIIYNPQTGEATIPSGLKRVEAYKETKRFSTVTLSWWFNHDRLKNKDNLISLLKELERTIPEALPRRYGEYEPPQEKYTGIDDFVTYFIDHINDIVWYPTKPVVSVNLLIPTEINFRNGDEKSHDFGYFSIEIDSAVLSMPGWKLTVERIFKNISEILCPFYGDIHILGNKISMGGTYAVDSYTEEHQISSWRWNGIPNKPGAGLVLGKPLLDYININKDYKTLSNGCKMVVDLEADSDLYKGIDIPDDLFQPEMKKDGTYQNTQYPVLWPFNGPEVG